METASRAMVDREIRHDTDLLQQVVTLLRQKTPLSGWPQEAASVLVEAIESPAGNPVEMQKADRLKRHLFIDMPPPKVPAGPVIQRRVDRLRSDLADLIDFGAGLFLTALWTPPR